MGIKTRLYGINIADARAFRHITHVSNDYYVNPLEFRGNYRPHRIIYEAGTLAVDGWVVTFVQRGGDWAGPQPAQAPHLCTKCNSPPINGSVLITVSLYNDMLLCSFNVSIKG